MKKLSAIILCAFLSASCGGGGGGSNNNTIANAPAVQKSVSGTASQGAALTGTAYLKDAKGAEITSAIDSTGGFKFIVDEMTSPFLLKAGTLYSFASSSGTANINPFTDLAVKNVSNVADMAAVYNGNATSLAPQLQKIQSKIQTAVDDLNAKIDPVFQKYGITASTSNFMTGSITIGQGVDAMFDTFKVSIATDGTVTMKTKTGDAPIFTATVNSGTGTMNVQFDKDLSVNLPSVLGPTSTTDSTGGGSHVADGGGSSETPAILSLSRGAVTVSVVPSGNLSYVIQGSKMDGVSGILLEISYDVSSLTSPSVTMGDLVSGSMFQYNTLDPGAIKIAIISTRAFSGNGQIAAISFASRKGTGGITSISADMVGQ